MTIWECMEKPPDSSVQRKPITKGISAALLDIKDACAGRDAGDVASWVARLISQRIGQFTPEKTDFTIELRDYITHEFTQWSWWRIWAGGLELIGSQGKPISGEEKLQDIQRTMGNVANG